MIQQQAEASTVAIYVSGLPVATVDEALMRQLFGAYGTISKVHLYRDKLSGRWKGDGLVVYKVDDATQMRDLVVTVCGQVSQNQQGSVDIKSLPHKKRIGLLLVYHFFALLSVPSLLSHNRAK